jgi:hypothetical protein
MPQKGLMRFFRSDPPLGAESDMSRSSHPSYGTSRRMGEVAGSYRIQVLKIVYTSPAAEMAMRISGQRRAANLLFRGKKVMGETLLNEVSSGKLSNESGIFSSITVGSRAEGTVANTKLHESTSSR